MVVSEFKLTAQRLFLRILSIRDLLLRSSKDCTYAGLRRHPDELFVRDNILPSGHAESTRGCS